MKLTKQHLNRIIQEELAGTLREQDAMQRGRDPRRKEAPAQDLPDWIDPHRDPNAPKTPVHRGPSVPGEGGKPEYWQREVGEGGPPLPDPGWSPQRSPGPLRDIDPGWSPRRSPGPLRDIDPGWSPERRDIPAREIGEGGPPEPGFDPSKNVAPRTMPRRKEDEPGHGDPGTRDWFPETDPAVPNWPNLPKDDEAPLQPVGPGTYTEAKLSKSRLNRIIQEEYERMLLENDEYSKYRDQHIYPANQESPDMGRADQGGWDGSSPRVNVFANTKERGWTDIAAPAGQRKSLETDVLHGQRVADEYETGAHADLNPEYIAPGAIKSWERNYDRAGTAAVGQPQRPADDWKGTYRSWADPRGSYGPRVQRESLTRQIERYIYKTLRG